MEQKIKSLKTASKAISILAKIIYTVMIVAVSICAVTLIFMAATGGDTSSFKIGGTNVIIFDAVSATPAQMISVCSILIALCGFLLAIFLFTYRMFHEISLTGDPFTPKHVMSARVIGMVSKQVCSYGEGHEFNTKCTSLRFSRLSRLLCEHPNSP